MSQSDWANRVFGADLAAIDSADIVIIFTPGRFGTVGTNWEQGYAFAKKKPILVIQYIENTEASIMTWCGCTEFRVEKDFNRVIKLDLFDFENFIRKFNNFANENIEFYKANVKLN